MAKKISDLPETTNIELDDIVWVDKYENGELKSKRFKLLSIFSKLKSVFGGSLFGTGDIDSPKDGKAYGRKDGDWSQVLENLSDQTTDDLREGENNKYFPASAASKLEGIEEGAQENVQADWSQTTQSADSFIKNKPNLLELGDTSTTAYRGDRGKIAYDHSQLTSGNPHGVTKTDVGLSNVDNTSDVNKPISTATQGALDLKADSTDLNNYIPLTQKGSNNGVAELDSSGKVPVSQLPSYVSDVETYPSLSSFPTIGVDNIIYIAADTNLTYRWTGSTYVEISPSIALGETSSTAYRGDRGAVAFNHSQQNTGNPHKVTLSNVLAQDSSTNGQSIELSGSDSIKQDESRLRFGSDVLFLEPKSRTSIGSGLVRAVNEVFEHHTCTPEDYLIVAADRTEILLSGPENVPVTGVEYVIYSIGECFVNGNILGVPGELNLRPNECITLVCLSGNEWGIISKNF